MTRKMTDTEIPPLVAAINRDAAEDPVARIDCSPDTVEQGLARLVLSLIEVLRRLLERQAIRRMEGGLLEEAKIEEMGLALMRLEAKIAELAQSFGLTPDDLELHLGPLSDLLSDK